MNARRAAWIMTQALPKLVGCFGTTLSQAASSIFIATSKTREAG